MRLTRLKARSPVLVAPLTAVGLAVGLLAVTVPAGSAGPFTPRTSADEPRNRPEAGAREKAESYEEGDRLDRQWEGAAAEIEGVTAPPPLHWGLTKDAGHVSRAGDVPNEILFDFKYKLDPAAKPKAIDLIPEEGPAKGKTLQGIYSLQRDELKVCFVSPNIPDPENQKRPGEFSAKKGSGYVLLVFRPDVLDEAVLSRAGFDKEELEFVRGVLAVVREERLMYFPKELKERWAKDMGKEERLARVESIAAKLDSLGKLPAAVIHPVDARIAGMRAPPVLEGATWHNAARPLGWKDLKGKVVLLDFMYDGCVPCLEGLPKLKALHERFRDKGLVVVCVHHKEPKEGASKVAELVKKHEIAFPVVVDTGETFARYRIDRAPTYLLVDRQGRVVPRRDRGAFSSVPTAEEIKELLGQVGGDRAENRGVPEGLIVWKQDKLVFLTAEGKEIKAVSLPNEAKGLHSLAVSPDRKRVALVASELPPVDRDGNYMRHVLIWDLAGAGKPSQLDLKAQNLAWTASGTLLVVEAASRKDLKEKKFTTSLVNPATNKAERLELPAGVQALAAMPDEKSFVARTYDAEKGQSYLDVIGRDGKRIDRLTELIDREIGFIFRAPVLSPDGSRLLFMDADLKAKLEEGMPRLPQLFVYDIKAKKRERLAEVPLNAFILGYAWSPDSRKVAYAWKRVEPGVPIVSNSSNKDDPKRNTETESFVVVADANGSHAKTVHSAKGPTGPTITIRDLDWR